MEPWYDGWVQYIGATEVHQDYDNPQGLLVLDKIYQLSYLGTVEDYDRTTEHWSQHTKLTLWDFPGKVFHGNGFALVVYTPLTVTAWKDVRAAWEDA